MSSQLKQAIVLELNKNWQRTKWRTVEEAIVCLCIDRTGVPNALAIPLGPDGIEGHPVDFDEWMKLPVREGDLAISTGRGAIRVPLAIISRNYADMPVKEPVLSKEGIFKRDGFVDQYTGEKLNRDNISVDHVIPKDVWKKRGLKGSPDRWDNLVSCEKRRNFNKSNKTNHQAGMKLIRKPKAPKSLPLPCNHQRCPPPLSATPLRRSRVSFPSRQRREGGAGFVESESHLIHGVRLSIPI